ncbi:hypothetical protein QUV00_22680, partial [Xanthomonas citri pv. citri]
MTYSSTARFSLLLYFLLFSSTWAKSQAIPEWQDPQIVSVNTERVRADFTPFPDEKSAMIRGKKSPFVTSLNGTWKFKWAVNPSKALPNFFDPNVNT